MKKIQKELRRKRTQYIVGLINQFKVSGEVQSVFNCYDYVKIEHENIGLTGFQESLPEDERSVLSQKPDVWFICLESLSTFTVFMQNQGINFEN